MSSFIWSSILSAAQPVRPTPQVLHFQRINEQFSSVRLSAATLSYQPARQHIQLKGQVRLLAGSLHLNADALSVSLKDGAPRLIEASGKVQLDFQDGQAVAQSATISLQEQRVRLSGNVQVKLNTWGLRLSGTEVSLDLATGQVTVQSARAHLQTTECSAAVH
jgi:lipopolysaccharide transport protein LptA